MTLADLTVILNNYRSLNPRYAPDFMAPGVVKFWFECLKNYSPVELRTALNRLIKEDHFPSIKEVELALGAGVTPQDDGIVIAGKIVAAISRFGWSGPEEARAMIGPVGWEVVQLSGGWAQVCNVSDEDLGIQKAQWRETARALLERGGRSLPELPPPMSDRGLRLIQGLISQNGVQDVANDSKGK